MEDNKLVPQTVYLPMENNISDFALAKLGRKQFADTLVTNQRLAKKDNQIVIDAEAFRAIINIAIDSYLTERVEKNVTYSYSEWKNTYIDNLFTP